MAGAPIAPQRVYIAPDDHTDYMWTADEAAYRQAFIQMIDFYLNRIDATSAAPVDEQAKWNCDGNFWLWEYERNKTPAEWNRLIAAIRSGHMSAPLNALVSCYGGQPAEAVIRGMYYAGRLERRYDLDFPLAVAMENQTLPYGLGSLWAGAGARYSWRGICGCASRVFNPGDREHDIYWYGGADGSKVLLKWNTLNNNQSLGGYAEGYHLTQAIDYVTVNAGANGFAARFPYDVIGVFGRGWDALKTLTTEYETAAQTQSDAGRRIIISNERDFFTDFESTYGPTLPTVAASFGNEWELYCASMAEVSARAKRATEKLRSAEAMATLVALKEPSFMEGREAARDLAFMSLGLYWEHNWTADGPISRSDRATWQRKIAGQIEAYVDTLHDDSRTSLGTLIAKTGANPRFFVFNPLSWARTDAADFPWASASPVHVVAVDDGVEVPSQRVTLDAQPYLRILAPNIPSVGYRVFEIRPGAPAPRSNAATVSPDHTLFENSVYRLTVDGRGAVTSFVDKTRGDREFARQVNGRFINDLGAGAGTIAIDNAGPVSVDLLATAALPLAHTSRITLYRDSPRIDFRNDINENFADVRTWGFGLNLDAPDVWHEEVGAVIRARLLADGGHYSPRNARYDWLTLNHFADMSDGTRGVTLSNADCYYMRLGNSTTNLTTTTLDISTPLISPLVGGQVDDPDLGIVGQDGDTHFRQRFALTTHDAFDAAAAMRFSLEHQNPLVTGAVTGGTAYPTDSYSYLTVSDPSVLLWALKPAEDGPSSGVVARLWNFGAGPVPVSITFPSGDSPVSASRVTHIETPIGPVSVSLGQLQASLAGHQIQSFLLKPASGAAATSVPWKSLR